MPRPSGPITTFSGTSASRMFAQGSVTTDGELGDHSLVMASRGRRTKRESDGTTLQRVGGFVDQLPDDLGDALLLFHHPDGLTGHH